MKKRLFALTMALLLIFGCAACGGSEEAPAEEQKVEETVKESETEATTESEAALEEDLTADLKEWFDIMYGDEYGPDWYKDVTDLRIVTANDKTMLHIESANPSTDVAQSMAMLIWGYDDKLIEDVYVFDQNGSILFEKHK